MSGPFWFLLFFLIKWTLFERRNGCFVRRIRKSSKREFGTQILMSFSVPVFRGVLETVSEDDCWVFGCSSAGSSSRFAPPVGMAPHATPYGGGPPKKHPRPLDSGLRRLSGLSVLRALESKEPEQPVWKPVLSFIESIYRSEWWPGTFQGG